MEKIEIIISTASTALTFLVTAIIFLIKFIGAARERNMNKVKSVVEEAVQYVEVLKGKSNGELTGELKKSIAMERIQNRCIEQHVKFNSAIADKMIESLVALSKAVNSRPKDLYNENIYVQGENNESNYIFRK